MAPPHHLLHLVDETAAQAHLKHLDDELSCCSVAP